MTTTPEDYEDLTEPDVLPEPIVDWQPTHRGNARGGVAAGGVAAGGVAAGSGVMLALAVGALAFGAMAIGALAIGRMSVGSARFRRLEIDELVVGRVRMKSRGG